MFQLIIWTVLLLLLSFVMFIAAKEIKAYRKLQEYATQGIQVKYIPFVGVISLFTRTKGSKDQLANYKKLILDYRGEKCVAVNNSMAGSAFMVLLDDKLAKEFLLNEMELSIKVNVIDHVMKGFALSNGEKALEGKAIFTKFLSHDNIVKICPHVDRCIDRGLKESIDRTFGKEDEKEVETLHFMEGCFCYLLNCILLGEDESVWNPSTDLSDEINRLTNGLMIQGLSVKNFLTFGILHKYRLFPKTRELVNDQDKLIDKIYERYLERVAHYPKGSANPNIVDCIIERNLELRKEGKPEMSKREVAGNWFLFQAAASEASLLLSTAMAQLFADNPEIQETMRKAVEEFTAKTRGKENIYEDLMSEEILDRFVNELLRLYNPSAFSNTRIAIKNFKLGDIKISKGTQIAIPWGMRTASEVCFDNASKFDINRMSKENMKNMDRGRFIPFGLGKRMCSGRIVGEMVSKLLVIKILQNFTILPSPNSEKTMIMRFLYGYENPKVILKRRTLEKSPM